MPGVPTGRGCDGCRKRKKKCDLAQPICTRCSHLRIPCIGSGKQRFVFKEPYTLMKAARSFNPIERNDATLSMIRAPNNGLDTLAGMLVGTISISTDFKYNIFWTYGLFFQDVPQRLGINEALDTSVAVMVAAHADFCTTRRNMSPRTLRKFSHALQTLRRVLDEPEKARSVETLCAVMVLMIAQTMIGGAGNLWTGHGEGAAQLLKARGLYNRHDEFERKLLLTLRGPVLFEGLFNERIHFEPKEWKILVENELDGIYPEGRMMQCLARVPALLHGTRDICDVQSHYRDILEEVENEYKKMKTILQELYDRWQCLPDITKTNIRLIHFLYQRSYGLGLGVCIIFNCLLRELGNNNPTLDDEVTYYCREVLKIADDSHQYRPLGASYLVLCLLIATMATNDPTIRPTILATLNDYGSDFRSSSQLLELEKRTWNLRRKY